MIKQQDLTSAPVLNLRASRIVELDVLRGIAILLVLGTHVPAYAFWAKVGWLGVDLFFVLSGFLISNLLFVEYRQRGSIGLGRFFLRRALKIYPSFYCLYFATLAYGFFWNVRFGWQNKIGEMLFVQNYLGSLWGHTWSLAVEEHFYILLPLVLALMLKLGRRSNPFLPIPYVFLIVAAGCLAARIATARRFPEFSHKLHVEPSHLRIDSLMFGVLLSYYHNFNSKLLLRLAGRWRLIVFLLGIAAILPCVVLESSNWFVYTFGFTLTYLGFGSVLFLAIYQEAKTPAPGRGQRAIAWVGFYSYSIYLWHVPLAMIFAEIYGRFASAASGYIVLALYFVSCLTVGCALSKLVEIPALRLRERLAPSHVATKWP
jgi:peptidoglycan/LPS O-acetylase OafA/YrhL